MRAMQNSGYDKRPCREAREVALVKSPTQSEITGCLRGHTELLPTGCYFRRTQKIRETKFGGERLEGD